jgi:hypothetical protein
VGCSADGENGDERDGLITFKLLLITCVAKDILDWCERESDNKN